MSVVIISSANTNDIKLVTDVVDNTVIKRRSYKTKTERGRGRRRFQHLCLGKAYNSEPEEQELIKRGYTAFSSKEKNKCKRDGDQDYSTTLLKSEKAFCKKMVGCRANKFMMAQQAQETVNKV